MVLEQLSNSRYLAFKWCLYKSQAIDLSRSSPIYEAIYHVSTNYASVPSGTRSHNNYTNEGEPNPLTKDPCRRIC